MTISRKRWIKRTAETVFGWEAALAARWSSGAHRRLMLAQWALPPEPQHFDHHIDLHRQWLLSRNPMWLERGVYSRLALKGGDVLELACGDGFNARNFYSLASRRVVGCDIDPDALATARRKNAAPNVEFVPADIRVALPPGRFDNVVWDFAFPLVRYFTPPEIDAIVARIKASLGEGGILSGYTLADAEAPAAANTPAFAFVEPADLQAFLQPHFGNVRVFETCHPGRRNFYFWASDGPVPFHEAWAAPGAAGATAT